MTCRSGAASWCLGVLINIDGVFCVSTRSNVRCVAQWCYVENRYIPHWSHVTIVQRFLRWVLESQCCSTIEQSFWTQIKIRLLNEKRSITKAMPLWHSIAVDRFDLYKDCTYPISNISRSCGRFRYYFFKRIHFICHSFYRLRLALTTATPASIY